jgi:hypothetical protein
LDKLSQFGSLSSGSLGLAPSIQTLLLRLATGMSILLVIPAFATKEKEILMSVAFAHSVD